MKAPLAEALPSNIVKSSNDESATITVEGARGNGRSLRRQVRNYLSVISAAQHGESLARWTRDVPLCAQVTGLPSGDNQLILERLLQIATSIGVPTEPKDCTPNLDVVMTSQPDELLEAWSKRDPWIFDSQIDYGGKLIQAFIHASTPVRSWYNVAFKGFGPFDNVPGQPVAMLSGTPSAPALGSKVRRDLWSVIIVVDAGRAREVSTDQLAAYLAMVGLAQIRFDAKLDDLPTILQLFADSKKAPLELSLWDRAFLKSLYGIGGSDLTQQFAIAGFMVNEVSQ